MLAAETNSHKWVNWVRTLNEASLKVVPILLCLDVMLDPEDNKKGPSTSFKAEKLEAAGPLEESVAVDEEKQGKSGDEEKDVKDKSNVEIGPDRVKMTGQSLVYTATKDTLFTEKISHTRNHALVSIPFLKFTVVQMCTKYVNRAVCG